MARKSSIASAADEPDKYAKDVSKHVRDWDKLSKREKERAALEAIGAWPRPNDKNDRKKQDDKNNRKDKKRKK